MHDERAMIDSEATTAGAQGGERCPHCDAPRAKKQPWITADKYDCGTVVWHGPPETSDDDWIGKDCLRRQLAQAEERAARQTSEIINAVRALPESLQAQGSVADGIRDIRNQLAALTERYNALAAQMLDAAQDKTRWREVES